MAFTGSYICTSFYTDLLNGVFDFSTHTFKCALYTSAASFTAATTAYTATNEIAATGGYTVGGVAITPTVSTASGPDGEYVILTFSNPTWTPGSFTSRGALIYDDTAGGNPAIAVMDFGTDKTGTSGTFVIQMPAATINTGLLVFQTVLSVV